MSDRVLHSVSVHAIDSSGEVVPVGSVPNAHACSLYICRTLSAQHGRHFDAFGVYRASDLSQLFGSPLLTEDDSIVLGFTFPHVWVRRERLGRLAGALEAFWSVHSVAVAVTGEKYDVEPAIPGVVELVLSINSDPTFRGACFDQTSVAGSVWLRPGEEPFRFGAGRRTFDGGNPWELFDELERRKAVHSAESFSRDSS